MKKLEKIIIVFILLASFMAIGVTMFTKSNNPNSTIVIQVDNKVIKKIPLNTLNESKIYEFSFNNNIGYVEAKNGKVRMLEMNREICPNAICSDTGWIDTNYQSIVCLPNKIIVTIEGGKDADIDIIIP